MKSLLSLTRNSSGHLFIGVDEINDEGYGMRSYVLSESNKGLVADPVMRRRCRDMLRLMGDNVSLSPDSMPVHQEEEGTS